MKIHRLYRTQVLPITLAEAWDFFSSPKNLREITPDYLDFVITNDIEDRMYPGQIITYTIRPALGLKVQWVTEITHVQEPYMFVDEQRFGPYKLWHHRHAFREVEGGIENVDDVHYALPMCVFGEIAHALYVKKQLEGIFDHRRKVLNKKFG